MVILRILWEQNFNLGLYSINFLSQRSNSIIQRWFFEFFYANKVKNDTKWQKLSPIILEKKKQDKTECRNFLVNEIASKNTLSLKELF